MLFHSALLFCFRYGDTLKTKIPRETVTNCSEHRCSSAEVHLYSLQLATDGRLLRTAAFPGVFLLFLGLSKLDSHSKLLAVLLELDLSLNALLVL
jgi:hypothetical protein